MITKTCYRGIDYQIEGRSRTSGRHLHRGDNCVGLGICFLDQHDRRRAQMSQLDEPQIRIEDHPRSHRRRDDQGFLGSVPEVDGFDGHGSYSLSNLTEPRKLLHSRLRAFPSKQRVLNILERLSEDRNDLVVDNHTKHWKRECDLRSDCF